jgi:outer membrane autotransporter protein
MRVYFSLAILAAGLSSAAHAQQADDRSASTVTPAVVEAPATAPVESAIWVAGVAGGLVDRDDGPDSPYAALSLTRYKGKTYVRGAFTVYRSTVQQIDAALPSTYYVGSVGAGGNWDDWVLDIFASYGRQDYGLVETATGRHQAEIGSGSGYFSAGFRAGRILRPAPHWYVTPTLGAQYAETKSLRHRFNFQAGVAEDFELPEHALTFNAGIRVDRAIGSGEKHFIGLSAAHYESDNGLTSWRLEGSFPNLSPPVAVQTPDGWQELGVSGTWRLGSKLWLDTQVQRTFGAIAGDSTTVSLGLRLRF